MRLTLPNERIWFLVIACCYSVTFAADVAFAKLDLREFGYQFTGSTSVFADYTDLGFLSEDLVLVSINQRSLRSVEPLFPDVPGATLAVFDVRRGSVLRSGKMSVAKMSGSVQVVNGERFAVLNDKGLQFCDATLKCAPPIETQGPMFVSPQGKRVAVGGYARSRQMVIDTESSKQIAVFDPILSGKIAQEIIPGDTAMLVNKMRLSQFNEQGNKTLALRSTRKGIFSNCVS